MWGATFFIINSGFNDDYFNPRPPCGGRQTGNRRFPCTRKISIHAPRVGGDLPLPAPLVRLHISIHAPRVGGDAYVDIRLQLNCTTFQSTPPVWGATDAPTICLRGWNRFQSTPPVWGATLLSLKSLFSPYIFQSTPPVWGATWSLCYRPSQHGDFNPRPPCGGRRAAHVLDADALVISIHAPRVGGDRAINE